MTQETTDPTLGHRLAAAGIASRRASALLVRSGRVQVDGQTVTEPGFRPAPDQRITFDGKPLPEMERRITVMLNKPRGYVCTSSDPHAGHRALELIRLEPPVRLFSAGRLDKESEGLILFSNDGELVAEITHPRYGILKRYEVRVGREFTARELEQLRRGITSDGEALRALKVTPLGACRYEFVLNEGKKREIRRLTAALGAPTLELRRVALGGLELGDLAPGCWRELSAGEIAAVLDPRFRLQFS